MVSCITLASNALWEAEGPEAGDSLQGPRPGVPALPPGELFSTKDESSGAPIYDSCAARRLELMRAVGLSAFAVGSERQGVPLWQKA
jgi:hypothetical protein